MVLDVENTMPCIQTSNLPSGRKCSFTEVNKHIKYVIENYQVLIHYMQSSKIQ